MIDGEIAQTPARVSPSPEAPVECPELWSAPPWGGGGAPAPGATFQDKGGWGGEAGPGEGQERGL